MIFPVVLSTQTAGKFQALQVVEVRQDSILTTGFGAVNSKGHGASLSETFLAAGRETFHERCAAWPLRVGLGRQRGEGSTRHTMKGV